MKKIILFAVLTFVILVGGYIAYGYISSGNGMPYELASVQKGTLSRKVSATGTINAVVTVPVGSQVSGVIKEIYVGYNSPVKKEQLLALIDPAPWEAQLTQAKASLESARALLEKAEAQFKESKLNVERTRTLFKGGFSPQSQLDADEATCNSALAQKKAQGAQVVQCEAAVNLAMVKLAYTKIKSPIDGIVLSKNIEIGQMAADSSLLLSTLFVIATDLTKMQIDINVSEADIGNIKLGQGITFTVDAYPENIFSGKVKEIHMGPDIKQNVVYYDVVAGIDNAGLLLRPSMTADVWIQTAYEENVLLLPVTAVKEKDGQKYVEVPEGRRIKNKPITAGLKGTDGFIKILTGLNEGDYVVVSGK